MAIPYTATANTVALWHLENTSDSSGNNKTLTNTNTVAFAAGKFTNAADFGATNSNKVLSLAENLGITGGNIMMSAWFNITTQPASGEQQVIIRQAENTNHTSYYIVYQNDGGVYTTNLKRDKNSVGINALTVTGQLTAGVWNHAALSYNSTNLIGIFNGADAGSTAATGNGTGANPNYITIGAWYNSALSYYYPFKGLVDEVIIENTSWTLAQLLAYYNAGSGGQSVTWFLMKKTKQLWDSVGGIYQPKNLGLTTI